MTEDLTADLQTCTSNKYHFIKRISWTRVRERAEDSVEVEDEVLIYVRVLVVIESELDVDLVSAHEAVW